MTKFILIFCAIISTIHAQCSIQRAAPNLRRSVYEFSISLLQRTAADTEYHFVSSPLSAWTLLACASMGATEKTLNELLKVLNLHRNGCYNKKYLEIVNQVTSVDEQDVFLERSSVIFADEGLQITDAFKNRVARSRVSRIENISFENVEQAAATINDFVREATHDTIDEIVAPGDLERVVMVMIDALFFKGSWTEKFSEEKTVKSAFYNDLNAHIGDVNLMQSEGNYNVTSIELLQAQVLELPYGENRRFSMYIFLSQRDTTLATMIDNFQRVSFLAIRHLFSRYGPSNTIVALPRFKISSDLNNLKELFADMGLRAPFDPQEASFPVISESESVYISSFIQKAEIEVNEQGTTASAATAAQFVLRGSETSFTANRPFVFMIVDNLNDIPIFTGAYSKPSLY